MRLQHARPGAASGSTDGQPGPTQVDSQQEPEEPSALGEADQDMLALEEQPPGLGLVGPCGPKRPRVDESEQVGAASPLGGQAQPATKGGLDTVDGKALFDMARTLCLAIGGSEAVELPASG